MNDIEQLRAYKIPYTGGMVILDWALTILGAWIFSLLTGFSFFWVLLGLLFLSIPLHVWFDVPTRTNELLGLSAAPN